MSGVPTAGYARAADGSPLYCVYHPPSSGAQPRRLSAVIVPSLFEERKSGYSALRRLAEKLAAAGYAALRFDYRGSGESGGDPAARRWAHLTEDVETARQALSRLAGKSGAVLIGLRLGAMLALQGSAREGIEGVAALAPVIKGATQVRLWRMRSKIRSELTQANAADDAVLKSASGAGHVFDFDGYEVGREFFEDVAKFDLIKDAETLKCPGLVLQLSHRTEAAPETLELVQSLGPRAAHDCLRIEQFWDKVDDVDTRPIEAAVLKWLETLS